METPIQRLTQAFLGLCIFLGTGAQAALLDCEIAGQHVNPSNGSTTAGKTGLMKCVDRETRKFVREEEYRDGRPIGHRKWIGHSGETHVANYNAQGNRDGEARQYNPAGTLIAEERYANGDAIGVQTFFHANGQARRRSFNEPRKGSLASIEYNDRGQVMELRCADRSLLPEDRSLCGFDGNTAEVTFHSAKGDVSGKARYENGTRISMMAYSAPGVVARTEETRGERRVLREHFPEGPLRLETVTVGKYRESQREHAKSGQPVRETRWNDGRLVEETLWYLNGQPRSKTRYERDASPVLVKSEEFWDNGKLRARSVRDERRNYVGVQQAYNDSGVLESESTYENGKLVRRKNYKDGTLVADEQYFEDGSRKSVRKGD